MFVKTAGLTLAARLTEDPRRSALLLESGPANIDDPNIREHTVLVLSSMHLYHEKFVQPHTGATSAMTSTRGTIKRFVLVFVISHRGTASGLHHVF